MEPQASHKQSWRLYFHDMVQIVKIAIPMTLTVASNYMIQPLNIMFCGFGGISDLGAASLGMTLFMIMIHPLCSGLCFSCNIFFSQLFGTSNEQKISIYIQRAFLLGCVALTFFFVIIVNSDTLLILIGQNVEVSRSAHQYLLYLLPGMLGKMILNLNSKYLECLGKGVYVSVINVLGLGLSIGLHYGFIVILEMRVRGGAIALTLTYLVQALIMLLFTLFSKVHRKIWSGLNRRSFLHWAEFNAVLIPAVIHIALVNFAYEICNIFAGIVSEELLATQTILFQLDGVFWLFPMGMSFAIITRMGFYLSKDDILGTQRVKKLNFLLQGLNGALIGIFFYLLRFPFISLFTNVDKVIHLAAYLMPFMTVYGFILVNGHGLSSILRVAGKNKIIVVAAFFSYYGVGLPLGVPLMFSTSLGLEGMLLAYNISAFFQLCVLIFFTYRIDWNLVLKNAQHFIAKNDIELDSEPLKKADDKDSTPLLLSSSIKSSEDISLRTILRQKMCLLVIVILALILGTLLASTKLYIFPKFNETTITFNSTNG